jgi:hypothetical protein
MLKKLLLKLGALSTDGHAVDPSQFADPVAHRTAWGPAKGGGASFCTHKLSQVDPYRAEFRATLGARAFYLFFVVLGVVAMVAFLAATPSKGGATSSFTVVFPVLIGLVFAIAGGAMFYFGTAPIVFDKVGGCFWKGRKDPNKTINMTGQDGFTPLEQIHSLQLISEYCRGKDSSYYSYELNLVLEDGKRVNVIDHGNLDQIRKDARTLSGFLQKPLWDAV